MNRRVRAWIFIPLAVSAACVGWAAFSPVKVPATRDELFAIPEGTWARRMSGDLVDILPSRIRLTLGVNDVLLLRNLDSVPQTFGPTLLMPGQSFRLPFEVASEYQFACSAHSSGQMTIIVDPFPGSPLGRLGWRAKKLTDSIRHLNKTT